MAGRELHRNPNYWVQGMFRGARAIITNLNAIERGLDLTRLAGTKTFSIDKQVKNFGIQIGLNVEKTTQLADTITGLSNVTGLSTGKTGELVGAMTAAGLSVGDLDASLSDTANTFDTISKGGAKNLEMMTEMIGRHGMAASAVIETNASLKVMGIGLGDLADKITNWQKQYKVPGMIGQIPKAVSFAEKSMVEFSHVIGISADQVIADSLKVGASFTKVYGIDIGAAMQKAQQNQQVFMQAQAQNSRVFLGLEENFSAMSLALFEHGRGFAEQQQMMKEAEAHPEEFAAKILKMRDAYLSSGQEQAAGRLMEQMRKSSSEAVKEMFAHPERINEIRAAHKAASEERESDLGKGIKSFAEMTGSLRNVGSAVLNTFGNLLKLGQAILGLSVADDLTKSFEGLHEWVLKLNIRIKGLATRFAAWRVENKHIVEGMQKVIKYAAILGGAAGVLSGALTPLLIPFTTFAALLRGAGKWMLPTLKEGSKLQKFFTGFGAVAKTAVKWLTIIPTVLYAGAKALADFGKSLADPNLTAPEILLKGIRGVFVGIVSAFDDLLMGIPSKIVKFFFPQMRGTLVDGVKRLFNGIQADMNRAGNSSFTIVFENIKLWIGAKLDGIWGWMSERLQGWRENAKEMGRNIGRAIGSLAKWAWTGMKWLFNPKTWKRGWDMVVGWFNDDGGPALNSSFIKIFDGILDVVIDFGASMADEILMSFGSSIEEAEAGLLNFKDTMLNGLDSIKFSMIESTRGIWLSFKAAVLEFGLPVVEAFSSIWLGIRDNMANFFSGLITGLVSGLSSVMFMAQNHINNMMHAFGVRGRDAHRERARELKEQQKESLIGTATMGQAIKKAIGTSKVDLGGYIENMDKAKKAAEDFNSEESEARRQKEYTDKLSARTERMAERNKSAGKAGRGKRAGRDAERENALKMGNFADEIRGGIRSRTEALITNLSDQIKGFTKAGDTTSATRAGHVIRALTQALDSIETENDPKKLLRIMKGAEALAGETAVSAMSPLAPTPTMGDKPELLDVAAQVAKARGEQVNPVEGSGMGMGIRRKESPAPTPQMIYLGLTGVGKELFEVQNPETNHVEISTN